MNSRAWSLGEGAEHFCWIGEDWGSFEVWRLVVVGGWWLSVAPSPAGDAHATKRVGFAIQYVANHNARAFLFEHESSSSNTLQFSRQVNFLISMTVWFPFD